jgi:hypothetical protein
MGRAIVCLLIGLFLGCSESTRSASPSPETPSVEVLKKAERNSESSNDRKIIYEAEISLVVEDFLTAEQSLTKLVKQYQGYLADATVNRRTGGQPSGRWTVRVPVAEFEQFLEAAGRLGTVESRRQTAQDVSEEFVDLDARINNSKRVEAEIQKLLEEKSGEIKDILAIQQRLGEVRGEIERMEGRKRYLENRTAYTTTTVYLSEERSYRTPESPTLWHRIWRGWAASLYNLQRFVSGMIVFVAMVLPWVIIGGAIALPIAWYRRRRRN